MSNEIKPGDLVMVVRGTACCGKAKFGRPFVVGGIAVESQSNHCIHCHAISIDEGPFALTDRNTIIEVSRLKKIDPPAVGDSLPMRADLPIKEKLPA